MGFLGDAHLERGEGRTPAPPHPLAEYLLRHI